MKTHAVCIEWSDEDNGFIASIPGIRALSAFGETREEALSELKIASKAYSDALAESGKSLPLLTKLVPYSGQLRLRMPKSLHSALSYEAVREGVSLNTHIVSLLSERYIERKLLSKIEKMEYFVNSLEHFTEDFMERREQPATQEREDL